MKGKFKYRVLYLYSITQAGCSPLAIEWLEVFFVLTSVVEEASRTLLRLQVVQVALLQVALRSSSSVFREHFYFCLGTCSRLMDTPTSLRIPYILLHVMIDCCREKHFDIRSLLFCGETFHANQKVIFMTSVNIFDKTLLRHHSAQELQLHFVSP